MRDITEHLPYPLNHLLISPDTGGPISDDITWNENTNITTLKVASVPSDTFFYCKVEVGEVKYSHKLNVAVIGRFCVHCTMYTVQCTLYSVQSSTRAFLY